MVKNHFFRNENWFNTLNYTFIYSGNLPAGSRELVNIDDHKYFGNFEKFGDVFRGKSLRSAEKNIVFY